jgi:hypothetical protein
MNNYFKTLFLILISITSFAQSISSNHQVVILGNLADVKEHQDFIKRLETNFNSIKSPFTVLINGDFTDNSVAIGGDRLALVKKVMTLVNSKSLANMLILPGDRDWNNSGKGGYKNVLSIEAEIEVYIEEKAYKRINWVIAGGCPGPFITEVNKNLVLITINTQWWNHPFDKPRPEDGNCKIITHRDFMEELEDAVDEFKDKNVLIIGHHPFQSLGNYGGYFSLGNHLQPLPIVGGFRVAYRRNVGSSMDISNENLHPLVEGMKNLFFFNKNLIYVSSHEHNHQVIIDNDNFMVNSGALQKGSYVANDPDARFTSKEAGWIALIYKNDGVIKAAFESPNKEMDPLTLYKSACESSATTGNSDTPTNLAYNPCLESENAPEFMTGTYPEFIEIVGGEEYKAGKWKQFWWGKHYRTTWTTNVKVPYLNLDTTWGGLTAYKKGGGRQTISLKFKSADNTVFVFRSVNKDPSKAFDYKLRPTLVSAVTKDQTSTQHPYGAMAVDPLLDKINILHAHPTLYVLPDDEKIMPFQAKYGNLFGMLEENPGKANDSGIRFEEAEKIERSNKFFRNLYLDHNNKIDVNEFVRARNFDILVGDWSKHEDNWKWAKYKSDGQYIYRPIPRDRDHVFSKQDGFFPYLFDREWGLQNIENFDYKIKGLKSLMWQARHMDRFIATEASRDTWIKEAKFIQETITDDDIDRAVNNMPQEIFSVSGSVIAEKMKERIKNLPQYAEAYYELLAKEVDVLGSKKKEYIEIDRADDGTVTVIMSNLEKDRQKGERQLYSRKFYPKETKEIRVYGLGGADNFNIKGEGSTKINIRVFGGAGDDTYKESGLRKPAKTLIYDKGKGGEVSLGNGAKLANYWNKDIYEYDRTRFKYNTYLPIVYLNYSSFNGFTLAGGVTFTRQRYDKEDYASKHSLAAAVSTKGNLKFAYDGRFHQAIKKWDILLKASAASPDFHNNFYGLGNSTLKTDALESANYYEIDYDKYNILTGVSRKFWGNSALNLTFGFESVESKKLNHPSILDGGNEVAPGAHETLNFLPIEIGFDLDFRDEKGLPYNGTRLFIYYTNGSILNKKDSLNSVFSYGYLDAAIEYYISTTNKRKITLGMRFGGAKGYGDIPFYKMPNLGGSNGLRGYSGQRFTGDSKIYFNSELRWQLLHRYTSIFPIKAGIKVFFDAGRVYYSGDPNESNKWHTGYGGGIYIVPFTEALIISISVGFSDEESFYPIIGFGTPLR